MYVLAACYSCANIGQANETFAWMSYNICNQGENNENLWSYSLSLSHSPTPFVCSATTGKMKRLIQLWWKLLRALGLITHTIWGNCRFVFSGISIKLNTIEWIKMDCVALFILWLCCLFFHRPLPPPLSNILLHIFNNNFNYVSVPFYCIASTNFHLQIIYVKVKWPKSNMSTTVGRYVFWVIRWQLKIYRNRHINRHVCLETFFFLENCLLHRFSGSPTVSTNSVEF